LQWYCDAKILAQPAIAAVETGRTRFVPRHWESTYFEWMRNIQPWCISRQLWWGHQIPAWYGPDGAVIVAETEAEAHAEAAAKYGRSVALSRDEDVLDTWFSSALWPFSTLGWPEPTPELKRYYPGEVLITGLDIIFFWVARMMMMGLHFRGEVPFRTVYIHALVRDAQGRKMSKSRGNIIDPLELIDRFGCDALRFTLTALAAPGRDINLDESRVAGYRNFATKLWNAARYAQLNGSTPTAEFDARRARLGVNRWIAAATRDCAAAVSASLDAFRFDEAANRLYQFVWGTFCDWYLEFSKPILQSGDAAAGETRAATGWVLRQILHLLHPIMPFLTEEIWQQLGGPEAGLLLTARWPDFSQAEADPADRAAADEMDWVVGAISAIRGVRAELDVPPAARLVLLVKDALPETADRVARHGEHFLRLARLARIELLDAGAAAPAGAVQIVVEGTILILPLGGVVDLAREKARLGREIGRLDAELAKIAGRLANPSFIAKAKPEIVAEQRGREAEAARDRERLEAAYMRLAAV
jgi:valyl-tRNA synthetase